MGLFARWHGGVPAGKQPHARGVPAGLPDEHMSTVQGAWVRPVAGRWGMLADLLDIPPWYETLIVWVKLAKGAWLLGVY